MLVLRELKIYNSDYLIGILLLSQAIFMNFLMAIDNLQCTFLDNAQEIHAIDCMLSNEL